MASVLTSCATRTQYETPTVYRPAPGTVVSRGPAPVDYSWQATPLPPSASARVEAPAPLGAPGIAQAPGQIGYATSSQPSVQSGVSVAPGDTERVVIPLHGERVQVGTREVEGGAVRLRKVIRTETVNQPVTLRREELVIDRLPADGSAVNTANGAGQQVVDLNQPFSEQSITIPLKRQEPVVETEIVRTGEVVAQKRVASESTTIQRPIREEDVQVVKLGDPKNVSISPSVGTRVDTGAAPGYQAGSAGAASVGPISSLSALASARDLLRLAEQPVRLAGVTVQDVIGNGLIALQAPDGQLFYVRTPRWINNLRAGDLIDLQGRILPVPRTIGDLGLAREAAAVLQSQPIFIDATELARLSR